MSFKGIVEFAVHIEGFRNIDLYNQGLYNARINIYHEENGEKRYAHPYHIREHYPNQKKNKKALITPKIIDATSEYVTRTILVRYIEEESDFNEVCHFRSEFEAYPEFNDIVFYMEAELMYSDMNMSSPLSADDNNPYGYFKSIAKFKAKISNISKGVHEYVPIIFDNLHYCVFQTNVHAVLMDLKFRNTPLELPKENTQPNEPQQKAEKKPKLPYLENFTEFLSFATKKFEPKAMANFFDYYVKTLRKSYERLVEFYAYSLRLVIQEEKREDLHKFFDEIPNKEIVRDYVLQDSRMDKNLLKKENPKEESKMSDPPKKLFDPAQERHFEDIITSTESSQISLDIQKEINVLAGNFFQTWFTFVDLMLETKKLLTSILKEEYHRQIKERWGESIFQQVYRIPDLTMTYEHKLGENHKKIAKARRSNLYFQNLDLYHSIEDCNMFPKADVHPIIFEEICVKEDINDPEKVEDKLLRLERTYSRDDKYKGVHLIVLCHGFQGNSWDMRRFKDNIAYLYPESLFLCSSANEDFTEGHIEEMGARLASEVVAYIKEWVPGKNLGRLSFIGHSLGGVIIRTCLPHLEEYKDKMHLLMTCSSPHLGYMYHSSKLIDAGMWFLKKWRKSQALNELTMTDASKVEDTFLYKLSSAVGPGWFKCIALLSSYQDLYAPFESARIQIGKKVLQDTGGKGAAYAKMTKNILSQVTADCIYRIDVNFKIPQKNIDSMIGRAAHIEFLDNHALMRMITYRFSNFFS